MNDHSEPGHGHSPAAWIAVTIMLVGFTIGTIAFFFEIAWVVWASAGLVLFGWILGGVLAKMGYGVKGPRYMSKART